ncbi:hypothetical protein G4B88_026359 [Cannabis sativa]|uniref:Uncharacterized protein n=1 Tax=Cannabis sativa TaxID=3483 RepID=A0A7J6E3A4_CANSA|nr:hypothetical protein G4B88_026359 [Cannabis sativa]
MGGLELITPKPRQGGHIIFYLHSSEDIKKKHKIIRQIDFGRDRPHNLSEIQFLGCVDIFQPKAKPEDLWLIRLRLPFDQDPRMQTLQLAGQRFKRTENKQIMFDFKVSMSKSKNAFHSSKHYLIAIELSKSVRAKNGEVTTCRGPKPMETNLSFISWTVAFSHRGTLPSGSGSWASVLPKLVKRRTEDKKQTCPFEPYAEYNKLPFSSFPPHFRIAEAKKNAVFVVSNQQQWQFSQMLPNSLLIPNITTGGNS